jgi:hypothetical protein
VGAAKRASVILGATAIAACGARTALYVTTADDGGTSGSVDARARDVAALHEAGDAGDDGDDGDALPPVSVAPPSDASVLCADSGATLVYVMTEQYVLYRFDPAAATFTWIGKIACSASQGASPFSMAVDHLGTAYVVFDDGELFRVSTTTASCDSTAFVGGQNGFPLTFGMGFSRNVAGTDETLYVAGGSPETVGAKLATIDVRSFALTEVGPFAPTIPGPELSGSGAGQLFAFYGTALDGGPGFPDSVVAAVEEKTARLTAESPLPGLTQGNAFAFAFWGGDFYLFTVPAPASQISAVTRFRPGDGSLVQVGQSYLTIVGAGVSVCAPQ